MENPIIPDGVKEVPSPTTPTVAPPNPEPKQKDIGRSVSVAEQLPTWLKVILVLLPLAAFVISCFSLRISMKSLDFSMGYTRPYEDHDVVARVLGVTALTKGFSSIVTNGELSVDVALINRGNQTEIIREAFLCYSDNKDFTGGYTWERDNPEMNMQFNKGERRVVHLSTPFNSSNTGKRLWLGVTVRAIAPNADDVQVVWPVCEINLASDGNGSWVSYNKDQTPQIQIISNQRTPYQKPVPDGF